ncbi:MAG: hypothetical protein SOY31_05515 [Bacilli bacterium]|nr:hypothetical protein [Bacilli bacterium]MDY4156430.1 hypothetical protein [Bacilli bacterium]MDY6009404.1 hypothetical protein [Bacilli bacterium]
MDFLIKHKRSVINITFLVLYLISSLAVYYGVLNIFGFITDTFNSLVKLLPVVISSDLFALMFFFYFRRLVCEKRSRLGSLIFHVSELVFAILSFVLMFLNTSYYFKDGTKLLSTLIVFVVNILAISSSIIYFIFKDKDVGVISEDFKRMGRRKISFLVVTYAFFGAYFVGDGLISIFKFANYAYSAFYLVLVIAILLPLFNLITFILDESKKANRIFALTIKVLDVIIVILALILFLCFSEDYIRISQTLFFIDYATIYPIGLLVNIILLLIPLIDTKRFVK